jgi:coenzyme F420-dependent glucose-6-phosphate dehydrogenase
MAPTKFGLTLSSEEHPPRRLVDLAAMAEDHGFDFASISDHFHPWVDAQGHSPFVWSVLGAIAERTSSIDVTVGVTCPIIRIHPGILAHATATVANLFEGRFSWGVGTGEALNEHIFGDRWPPAPTRMAQLEEAVEVIRRLWTGETVDHEGRYYQVENARLYDPPEHDIPLIVSAFGPVAAEMAARIGDGLWTSDAQIVDKWHGAGGSGPVYTQVSLCWAASEKEAIETAFRVWPNTVVPGQLSQDLPTPKHFEQATEIVTEEMVADSMPCGPDVGAIVEAAKELVDGGADHVYFHQIGPDQEGFLDVWDRELRDALRAG